MSTVPSNIRVFVHFTEPTVFAGDEIECTITYKNVDTPRLVKRSSVGGTPRVGSALRRASQGAISPPITPSRPTPIRQASGSSYKGGISRSIPAVERPVLSLNVVDSVGQDYTNSPSSRGPFSAESLSPKNERKVSVMSLGKQGGKNNLRRTSQMGSPRTPTFGHRRSFSANYLPGTPNTLSPIITGGRPLLTRSPLSATSAAPFLADQDFLASVTESPSRRLSKILPKNTQGSSSEPNSRSPSRLELPLETHHASNGVRTKKVPLLAPIRTPRRLSQTTASGSPTPMSPVDHAPSIASPDHTPRSSIDPFNLPNNSSDTLLSEIATQPSSISPARMPYVRAGSSLNRVPTRNRTEILMMGFAQISGYFTLDGSLVNEVDFEEVKRKAVVGGQGGGGVIGIEKNKNRNSGGIFGTLGWGSLTQSFGNLLGGDELSTIKEMKGIADSKSIPLITTPKSILFVDLQLAPGESKSYRFSFTLPRGLPPSHKGRAMKVTYHLVVGTQRPSSVNGKQQQPIRSVEIPFRVFGGVNAEGEVLGHNLMSPYIILRDQARTSEIYDTPSSTPLSKPSGKPALKRRPSQYAVGLAEFQTYVNHLLESPRKNSSYGLLSPTASVDSKGLSYPDPYALSTQASSTRDLIDLTIRRSGLLYSSEQSATNFTITRASKLIANVVVSRPAFKLGDFVSCVVDFAFAQTPCYGLEMTLESSEKVDPSLAIRSPQSVERATRRSWARTVDSALWSRRCVFNAQIPTNATPTFSTTGVGLDWCVRVEFVVAKQAVEQDKSNEGAKGVVRPQEESLRKVRRLLEEVNADERGITLSAKSYLVCESFEVTVPIRVFGASVGDVENGTGPDGLSI